MGLAEVVKSVDVLEVGAFDELIRKSRYEVTSISVRSEDSSLRVVVPLVS